jgi:hypothetical protein
MRARRSHRAVLVLAFLGVIAAAPSTASATGTLDQQFIPGPPATNAPIGGSGWKAQSFEAGATGALDQVDLLLWKQPTTTAPLTVEIRTCPLGSEHKTGSRCRLPRPRRAWRAHSTRSFWPRLRRYRLPPTSG